MPNGTSPEYILTDLNSRLRTLESKYSLLGERLLVVNQNMIEEYKKLLREIKTLDTEIKEVKKEIFNLKDTIKHMVKEISAFARKEELKILEKYINLWDPMKFVTEEEVKAFIKEAIKETRKRGGKTAISRTRKK